MKADDLREQLKIFEAKKKNLEKERDEIGSRMDALKDKYYELDNDVDSLTTAIDAIYDLLTAERLFEK